MSIKFLVLGGGGVFWVLGGGGECRFYFYGRGDFSEKGLRLGVWFHPDLRFGVFRSLSEAALKDQCLPICEIGKCCNF